MPPTTNRTPAMTLIRKTLFPALCVVLALVYGHSIRGLRGTALAYPAIVAGAVLVLAVVDLAAELVRRRAAPPDDGRGPDDESDRTPSGHEDGVLVRARTHWRSIALVLALAGYAGVMQVLGFYTSTAVFLLAGFLLLRVPVARAAVTTVCCLPVMYVVFTVLFDVSTLPRGLVI
ncbi:tripartite tricarboxylate transporter TctB family protein [Streptomyces sp. NPDC050560]|uniref:tripartite tricarboxylate transporter TctB family protein n=1 Tax=Streptomyces sp. NPDC050560 TaxID=3365630 RepID=UPI00379B8C1E